jgi:hypothetical protein
VDPPDAPPADAGRPGADTTPHLREPHPATHPDGRRAMARPGDPAGAAGASRGVEEAPARADPAAGNPRPGDPAGGGPTRLGAAGGEPGAAGSRSAAWWAGPPPETVTVAEVVALGLAALVGVVATVGLAAAHLGVFGLAPVLGASAVVAAALAALARSRVAALPRVALDPAGLLPVAAGGALGLALFLPGFHYAAGGADPGVYVMHAIAMARDHSAWIHDPLLAAGDLPVQVAGPGARFPGIWISDAATGTIRPQFYHLWPALLATSYDGGGYAALVATTPVLGGLGVALAAAAARRIAGPVAGWAAALLLATNMMEVWQAKYPTTEILAQVLFTGALLGVLLAIQTGWRWPALVGGLLVGIGYLARPDGVLLVLFAVGVLALLWVLRRFDARAGWFAAGLAAILPYAFWQAYGPAGPYTRSNGVPGLPVMLGLIAACAVGALVLRRPLAGVAGRAVALLADELARRRAGALITLVAVGLFGLARLRGRLFGPDYVMYGPRLIRSYDEMNLQRLSWFFTWPGMLLVLAGFGVVALRRRWSPSAWLVAVPTAGLLAFYVWHARNSPYFMWVGRRFIPSVVPGMVLLSALALAALWVWKVRGRRVGVPLAVLLAAFVCAVQLSQSLPLRGHDELGGSYRITRSVAALSGDERGVYLWAPVATCCTQPSMLFAPTVWLIGDQDSVLVPSGPRAGPYVQRYAQAFPDRPLFLVYPAGTALPPLPGLATVPAAHYAGTLPRWQESSDARPGHAEQVPYDFTVYRVTPAG